MNYRWNAWRALTGLGIMVALASCGGGGSSTATFADLRVIHAASDAPNVDVLVTTVPVLTNVPYKAVSNALQVNPGNTRIQVNPTGTQTSVIDVTASLASAHR